MSSNEAAGVLDVANIKYNPATNWRESRGRLPVIGIGGPFGSGKDECAKAVAGMFDNAVVLRFADGVREGLLRMNPIVHANSAGMKFSVSNVVDAIGWDDAKKIYPEVRRLMQAYGDEAGREIHGQDCWVKRLNARVEEMEFWNDEKRPQCYVVPDVRYPGEIDFINKYGLGCMFVDRPGIDTNEAARQHASESHFRYVRDNSQRIVVNDGTLEQLHDRACRAASRLVLNLFVDEPDEWDSNFKKRQEFDKLRFINGEPSSKMFATDGKIAACVIADEEDRQWCLANGAKLVRDDIDKLVREHFPDGKSDDESNYIDVRNTSGIYDCPMTRQIPANQAHCDHDDIGIYMAGTSGFLLAKYYHDILLRLPGCRFYSHESVNDDSWLKFRFGNKKSGHLCGRGLVAGLNVDNTAKK